jgi:hypothetical protein
MDSDVTDAGYNWQNLVVYIFEILEIWGTNTIL